VGNAQKIQQIRDYMARNNILNSGENIDAMLRSNSDYSNAMGNINNNESSFNTGLDTQYLTGQREQADKITDVNNRRRVANENYNNELQSYYDQIDALKLADQEAEAQQQKALAAQKSYASSSRSSGGGSGSSSTASEKAQKEQMLRDTWINFRNELDNGTADSYLKEYRDSLIATFGNDVYNEMYKFYQENYNENLGNARSKNGDYQVVSGGRMLM
jgi:hypothetical protein